MKQVRMIVVLLLCMLMTSLLGCTTGSQATDESTTELITEAPMEFPVGDIPLRYISSPDEYVQFVASATLPDNFVYYADISELGAFVSFVCEMGTINNYTYGIMDESGTELTLYIDPIKNDNQILAESTLNASDINSSSMKTLKNENGGGAYSYNGILYKYRNGRLSSIVWQNDGFQYTLANTIPREE